MGWLAMIFEIGAKTETDKNLPLWVVHCLMLLATIVVSSSFTVGKAITHGLDPAVLLLIRFVLAVFLFFPILVLRREISIPSARQLRGYATISFCTVGFFWCMFEALRYTTALNTSVIYTLVPGISGIYSAVFLRERLGRSRFIALILGMVGALWVIFRGNIDRLLGMEINHGDIVFLTGCFLMAAYTPLIKKLHRQEPMTVMTFWVLATGVVWLLILSFSHLSAVNWLSIEPRVWGGIIYLAVFSTIITFFLTQIATLYLGPTRVMAYSYFYPVFVLVIDWAVGNGLPTATAFPGVVVVSLATVVLQRGAVYSAES